MDQIKNNDQDRERSCCPTSPDQIRSSVREHYAKLVSSGDRNTCCGQPASHVKSTVKEKMAKMIGYSEEELSSIPEDAYNNALGCGNPLAFAEVKEGEVVLDIGSGAGIDVILASKKVGTRGRVIGLDMTPKMIERGRRNVEEAGVDNVEFRFGVAESMPVEDESVDVIISNCVINLSPDKKKVFQEAYRVLKAGGRILISDIVTHALPQKIRNNMSAWVGCVAGALEEEEYLTTIKDAGFKGVEVVGRMFFDEAMVKGMLGACEVDDNLLEGASTLMKNEGFQNGMILSVRVKASK